MVLLENFRAEPLANNLKSLTVIPMVTAMNGCAPMMPHILKFGGRPILKGPRTREKQFFHIFRREEKGTRKGSPR
jgi:hypothetical protein